jgi:hypothetical protein
MIIGDQEYIAKELIDVGQGRSDLSLEEGIIFLSADLVHLK